MPPKRPEIKEIVLQLREQGKTMTEIVDDLNSKGFKTSHGNPYSLNSVNGYIYKKGSHQAKTPKSEMMTLPVLESSKVFVLYGSPQEVAAIIKEIA